MKNYLFVIVVLTILVGCNNTLESSFEWDRSGEQKEVEELCLYMQGYSDTFDSNLVHQFMELHKLKNDMIESVNTGTFTVDQAAVFSRAQQEFMNDLGIVSFVKNNKMDTIKGILSDGLDDKEKYTLSLLLHESFLSLKMELKGLVTNRIQVQNHVK